MFVGLEEGTKGWRVRLPNRTTVTSREVRFLEDKLGVSDVDTIITAADLDRVMGEFQEISSEGGDAPAMLGPAHPLWRPQEYPQEGKQWNLLTQKRQRSPGGASVFKLSRRVVESPFEHW
jgi:hypothetical protein